jgi:DNA-binding IclR family transcriptional regulator
MPELNATEKTLKILTAFLPNNTPRGNLDLSRVLGIHRASVNRILGILKQHGFVQQNEKTKMYRLGSTMAVLGQAIRQSFHLQLSTLVQPHLHKLTEKIRESVALVVLADHHVVVPYRVRGPQPVSVSFDHGEQGAINANAGAKAILAFLSDGRLEEVIGTHRKLPSFTPNTLTRWDQIVAQFEEIRQTGVAYDLEEYTLDVLAIGSPVIDYSNEPVCAVSILVPSFRSSVIYDQNTLSSLKQTASAISSELKSITNPG